MKQKHIILSVDEINKLQIENTAYKQSEQEATEIIAGLKAYKDVNEDFKTAWEELKAENDRLKEEVETRDNLVEHFRKEAINWAKISNDCIKDIENYKQTLQEIKELINTCMEFRACERCKFFKMCDKDLEGCILSLITKAEEE